MRYLVLVSGAPPPLFLSDSAFLPPPRLFLHPLSFSPFSVVALPLFCTNSYPAFGPSLWPSTVFASSAPSPLVNSLFLLGIRLFRLSSLSLALVALPRPSLPFVRASPSALCLPFLASPAMSLRAFVSSAPPPSSLSSLALSRFTFHQHFLSWVFGLLASFSGHPSPGST